MMERQDYVSSGHGPLLIAIISVLSVLSTLATILRVYTRTKIVKVFAREDWFAVLSWMIYVVHVTASIMAPLNGVGQHVDQVEPQSVIPVGIMWCWISSTTWILAGLAIRQSVAFMLLRHMVERSQRISVYCVTAVSQVYILTTAGVFVFHCMPPSYFWTRLQGNVNGQCLSNDIVQAMLYGHAAILCATDIAIAILTWWMVRKLNMDTQKKVVVAVTLASGSIALIATIIRLPYLSQLNSLDDFLFNVDDLVVWSCVEVSLCILGSSAITLRPLIRKLRAETGRICSAPVRLQAARRFVLQQDESVGTILEGKPQSSTFGTVEDSGSNLTAG